MPKEYWRGAKFAVAENSLDALAMVAALPEQCVGITWAETMVEGNAARMLINKRRDIAGAEREGGEAL